MRQATVRRGLVSRVTSVEALRYALPINQYLMMLHTAACTGKLPELTPEGKPTAEFYTLSGAQRMDLIMYMVDKVMPARPPDPALVNLDIPESETELANLDPQSLTSEELRHLARH